MLTPMCQDNNPQAQDSENPVTSTDGVARRPIPEPISGVFSYGMDIRESETFMGPLPSPRIMKGYADILPDAPERILKMTEEQHRHQISMDESNMRLSETDVREGYKAGKRGQWLGFSIGVLLIGCGMCAMLTGHDGVALMIFGTSLAAAIAIFLKDIFKKKS